MSELKIEIIGNCLILPNGKSQAFENAISEYIVHRGMIFILLERNPPKVYNENVFALDQNGNIIWQIEKMKCLGGANTCPFTGINVDKETGNLLLYNWSGFLYTVVPETGEILGTLFTK